MSEGQARITSMVISFFVMWLVVRSGPSKVSFKEWMKATLWPFKEGTR